MRSASRPCSPVHHHEGHTKLASSPPRASPVRMGPSYVLKKGSQGQAGRVGQQGSPGWSAGWKASLWLPFLSTHYHGPCSCLSLIPLVALGREWGAPSCRP